MAGKHTKGLFNHFALTKKGKSSGGGGKSSDYLAFDTFVTPKLPEIKRALHPEDGELKSMWMVGLVDDETQTHVENDLNDLQDFIKLPGGRMIPAIAKHLYRLNAERENEARPSSVERAAAQRNASCDLVKLHDGLHKTKMRIKEIDRKAAGKKARKARAKRSNARAHAIYGEENRRLRRVIRKEQPKITKKLLRARQMEALFNRQREETNAARLIQRSLRRYSRLLALHRWLDAGKPAIVIQRFARGFLARRKFAQWWARKMYLNTLAQALVRGVQLRERLKHKPGIMHRSATKIQKISRAFFGRRRFQLKLLNTAIVHIQRVWRGSECRTKADRAWLFKKVIDMQRMVRGLLHRRYYASYKAQAVASAVDIQRSWRAVAAHRLRNRLLYRRSVKQRADYVAEIRSDADWFDEVRQALMRRYEQAEIKTRMEAMQLQEQEARETIRQLEFDYLAFKRERTRLSPRAIKQSMTQDVDQNIVSYREKITKAKIDTIFHVSRETRKLEEADARYAQKKADLEQKLEWLERWRKADRHEVWEIANEMKWRLDKRTKMFARADQMRRWKVMYHVQSGKPDSRRRYGRPWDASVYKESYTQSIGNANLLAKDIRDQIHLQQATNQFVLYGSLLKPVMDGMQTMTENLVPENLESGEETQSAEEDDITEAGDAASEWTEVSAEDEAAAAAAEEERLHRERAEAARRQHAAHQKEQQSKYLSGPGSRRRDKKRKYRSKINWALLDELEEEREKLRSYTDRELRAKLIQDELAKTKGHDKKKDDTDNMDID